jgi:hypothetical protein
MIGRYQSTGRFRSRADLLATAESRRARLAQRRAQLAVAKPCSRVSTGIDVHSVKRKPTDSKFSFRRPDVSVHRCIERGSKLSARDTPNGG